MKEIEKILIEAAKEHYESGTFSIKKNKYNSAVVLFFKSLIALCDIYILRKTKSTPSSHNSRFRILKEISREVYDLLDKDFPFYQESYFQRMTKELAEIIKDDAENLAKKLEIEL